MLFLFPLAYIFFLCVFLVVVFGLLLGLCFPVSVVVGIGLHGVFSAQKRPLSAFLFYIPMWVLYLLVLIFGCLVGFWLCVEQFPF